MLRAITREPAASLANGERTFIHRQSIDLQRVVDQHRDYRSVLEDIGATVTILPALEEYPDSVFVEDAALVVDEVAVLMPMGASSRRGEPERLEPHLAVSRTTMNLEGGGRVEGGDVVRLGRVLYVGRSSRTDSVGAAALERALGPYGYQVVEVPVMECLHLKSGCTALDEETLLVNPGWIDTTPLSRSRCVEVDPKEPGGANAVSVSGIVLVQATAPRTADLLGGMGFDVRMVDVSELAKAEGSLTCMSLLFEEDVE